MPTEVVRAAGHSRARSLGWLGAAWIEHCCIHGPGDIQGTPLNAEKEDAIPLSDEVITHLIDCYALETTGRRLYDSVFYSRPKGANKSGLAAWIACFEALGPCRFGGWAEGGEVFEQMGFRYVYQAGDPMGVAVTYPFLRIMATEEGQTGNVYDSVYLNLREGPLEESFPKKDDVGLTRVFLPGGGEIRPSTASSAAKDGGKESWANFDETHLYKDPELRRMYATVRRNMAKRREAEPWSDETSTMYQPGQDSIAERSHRLAERMMADRGKPPRERSLRVPPRFLFDHRFASPETDLADEASLRKGLAEAYGDASSYMDFDRTVAEIWDPRNDPVDSRRYFLNQAVAGYDAWLTPQEVDQCVVGEPVAVAAGEIITLGFDGSRTDDTSVLTGCRVSDGYEWPVGIWDPAVIPGHEVSGAEVDAAVARTVAEFDVVGFYSDYHPFESYVDRWEQLYGEHLCARVTSVNPVRWDMRSGPNQDGTPDGLGRGRQEATTRMIEAYHAAIVEGDVPLSADPTFLQHHKNARRRPNNYGVSIGKEQRHSPLKIDSVPSAALAWKARQDYLALPESKRRQQAGWHGIFVPRRKGGAPDGAADAALQKQ